jgi:hypothetical protein
LGTSARRCCALVALVVASLTAAPAQAANGTYTQHLCFDADTAAGVGVPPEVRIDLGGVPLSFTTTCSGPLEAGKGLSLVTGQPEHTPDGARGGLSYIVPANLTIVSGRYYRAFKSPGNGAYFVITENGETSSAMAPSSIASSPAGSSCETRARRG